MLQFFCLRTGLQFICQCTMVIVIILLSVYKVTIHLSVDNVTVFLFAHRVTIHLSVQGATDNHIHFHKICFVILYAFIVIFPYIIFVYFKLFIVMCGSKRGDGQEVKSHPKVRKEAKIRKRYNQVPHLTQDTTRESNKNNKHHLQEPRGQPFSSR